MDVDNTNNFGFVITVVTIVIIITVIDITVIIIIDLRQEIYAFAGVYLFVCLSVRLCAT